MPKALHDKLSRQVNKEHPGWTKEHKSKYIYGTMNKIEKRRSGKRKTG